MRSVALSFSIAAAVGMFAGVAHADRNARANTVFFDRCSHCHHDSAKLRTRIATDKLVGHGAKDGLRAWLTNPVAVNESTLCDAGRLDLAQRDTLYAFLKTSSDPVRRERTPLRAVAARHRGFAPAPPPVEPKLGQGDHR